MAAFTVHSYFWSPRKKRLSLFPLFPHLFDIEWWDWMPWSSFFEIWVLSQLFHFPFSPLSRGPLVPLHFLPLGWYHAPSVVQQVWDVSLISCSTPGTWWWAMTWWWLTESWLWFWRRHFEKPRLDSFPGWNSWLLGSHGLWSDSVRGKGKAMMK